MRAERFIETWATVIIVDVAAPDLDERALNIAVDKVQEFFFEVNEKFSSFIPTSEISLLRSGQMEIGDASRDVQNVWNLCGYAREVTLGAFDPWAVEGGFEPSGLVKGWAAECAAEMLLADGVKNILINAAGDLVVRGGRPTDDGKVRPWEIGISNPTNPDVMAKTFDLIDGSISTSGDYIGPAHIRDPHTGLIAIGARSASVIGPNGAMTDAFATALMVDGRDAQKWIGRPEIADYSFWVVNRDDATAWSYGPAVGR